MRRNKRTISAALKALPTSGGVRDGNRRLPTVAAGFQSEIFKPERVFRPAIGMHGAVQVHLGRSLDFSALDEQSLGGEPRRQNIVAQRLHQVRGVRLGERRGGRLRGFLPDHAIDAPAVWSRKGLAWVPPGPPFAS